MFKRGMDSQGQLSVEYLLLLVVIFAVFGFMVTYLIGPSIDASNDISDVSDASNAFDSIVNAISIVYANGPGSKRTINVYTPDMVFYSGYNIIYANVTLSNGTTKKISATTSMYNSGTTRTLSKGWHKVTITWPPGANYILNTIL